MKIKPGLISGIGLGLRPQHFSSLICERPKIPWLEVLIDNYFIPSSLAFKRLERIAADYPLVFHGVGLSIGSPGDLSREYLKRVRDLIRIFKPAWYSEHLSFSRFGKNYYPDLFPLPRTRDILRDLSDKMQYAQDFVQLEMIWENISAYYSYPSADFSETEFLYELQRRTKAGYLIDLNNIVVGAAHGGLAPERYLADAGNLSVKQFHLAGYENSKYGPIDTHGDEISDAVIKLWNCANQIWPNTPACIERDNNIPCLADLLTEREVLYSRSNISLPQIDAKVGWELNA